MVTYQYGGKQGKSYQLNDSDEMVVLRTTRRLPLNMLKLSPKGRSVLDKLDPEFSIPVAGVRVMSCSGDASRDEVRKILKQESEFRFVGRSLQDNQSKEPVLYTENFFIKMTGNTSEKQCLALLKKYKLTLKRVLTYAHNAFFVSADEGAGQEVFDRAMELLTREKNVEYCHPEMVREMGLRAAFPQQWHLKSTRINGQQINAHASIVPAWTMSQGAGTTIAIIDDGLDMDHEEFRSSNKIVSPRDASLNTDDPSPHGGENHGTACAGVACADGLHGASGVAPKAQLMPVRLRSGLGSQAEADSFYWAATNGADVISCSWGPVDGPWWDTSDLQHNRVAPLPDSTRLAIDWAIQNGRNGKGCVITWAAGNGNESVDNDGYASYDKVIAVAACNDHNTRSVYSDFGDAVWCSFPSSDFSPETKTDGIWTTDRTGQSGYNPGDNSQGDSDGNYTNSFGGTSSACPGAAGVASLVIARNPHLRWDEIKDIMKRSCDQIDFNNGNYNASGHSSLYGYGRLNAKKAVQLARPAKPKYTAIHTAIQDVSIKDLKKSGLPLEVGERKLLKSIKVIVDIEHTYVGDLIVSLQSPTSMSVSPIKLHERSGGGVDNIKKTYDAVNTPELSHLIAKNPQGSWILKVEDRAAADTGKIRKFTLELGF